MQVFNLDIIKKAFERNQHILSDCVFEFNTRNSIKDNQANSEKQKSNDNIILEEDLTNTTEIK